MRQILSLVVLGALSGALSMGCGRPDWDENEPRDNTRAGGVSTSAGDQRAGRTNADARGNEKAEPGQTAIADIAPSQAPGNDDVSGTVIFKPAEGGMLVHAEVTGLSPNSKHGFHIHEKGDLSAPDLSSAGAHFDPGEKNTHGGPDDHDMRHEGDLGNLEADGGGKATYEKLIPGLTIVGESSILGKAVIIHEKADDLKTDPSGNSGARIAGGVIRREGANPGSGDSADPAETRSDAGDGAASEDAQPAAADDAVGESTGTPGDSAGSAEGDADTADAGIESGAELDASTENTDVVGPADGVSDGNKPLGEKDANNALRREE